jgi:hypothetical protein
VCLGVPCDNSVKRMTSCASEVMVRWPVPWGSRPSHRPQLEPRPAELRHAGLPDRSYASLVATRTPPRRSSASTSSLPRLVTHPAPGHVQLRGPRVQMFPRQQLAAGACPVFGPGNGHERIMSTGSDQPRACRAVRSRGEAHVQWREPGRGMSGGWFSWRGTCPLVRAGPGHVRWLVLMAGTCPLVRVRDMSTRGS